MANEEIYDSSNSQLSSDEYTHDEDDDALMDVAVSKQTPTKTRKPQSSSTETTPDKSSSNATTPRKLSDDLDAGGTLKPPTTREIADRQIKQMLRNRKSHLYFKRRSIKWLNQRFCKKFDYKNQLSRAKIQNQERARRVAEYRAAKRVIEMREQQKEQNHSLRGQSSSRSASRSHSRSHSGSNSPELICLDDTENEETPEKPKDSPVREELEKKTAPPFNMKLDLEAAPAENGSILDEFLTLKPVTATVPIIEEVVAYNNITQDTQQLELTTLNSYKTVETIEHMEATDQESTLKRRRSTTPPTVELNLPAPEKRSKTLSAEDDDDDIEFMPTDMSTNMVKRPTPASTPAQKPAISNLTVVTAAVAPSYSADSLNTPEFNVGTPFTLTPSNVMQFFKQQKATTPQLPLQQQQESENSISTSFKLETPTTPVEPMEIVYQTKKSIALGPKIVKATEAATSSQQQIKIEQETFAVPNAMPQKIVHQQEQYLLQQLKNQQMHVVQQQSLAQHMPQTTQQNLAQQLQQISPPNISPQQLPQVATQNLSHLPQHSHQIAEQHTQQAMQPNVPHILQQTQPQQQQQLQQQTQPLPQQPRPKQQLFEVNAKPTATPQPPTRNKSSSADLNNSNSDAVFHQRLKELYTQLDEIMGEKLRSVKPDLKSFGEEKQRLEADIKALNNLINIKEDEHNRLLHLRFTKEELLARVERKERILIIQELLPSLLHKNCSTAELYEINAMLQNEQNATIPSRNGVSAVEQILNRMENGLDQMNILRSVLGLQEKPTFNQTVPVPQFEGTQRKRHSVPATMRPPPPAAAFTSCGRQASMRAPMDAYRYEHAEELLNKRKPQASQSRFQQLINESRQLINSTLDHGAGTSQRHRQQQLQAPEPMEIQRIHTNLVADNHFDSDLLPRPLYNSSPLTNQSRVNNANQYNNQHSMYRTEDSMYNNNNNNDDRSKRYAPVTNGPEELERLCQHCKRRTATHKCSGCQNQWYCSRECQVLAWDTHWKSCGN